MAPVIQGERMPDDETDKVVHRNGRFINNVFVPNNQKIELPEVTITSKASSLVSPQLRRSGRSYNSLSSEPNSASSDPDLPFSFSFSDFYTGREQDSRDAMALESRQNPVYAQPDRQIDLLTDRQSPAYTEPEPILQDQKPVFFIPESPDSLHADRSPYTFEPADSHGSLGPKPSSSIVSASSDDFVITEHTYQMCATCPTFSIPIPVPKSVAGDIPTDQVINPFNSDPAFELQHLERDSEMSLVERVIKVLNSASRSLRNLLNPGALIKDDGFSDRLSTLGEQSTDSSMVAFVGLAVGVIGALTVAATGLPGLNEAASTGRDFPKSGGENESSLNSLALSSLDLKTDILCLPRSYCEEWKSRKHLIDEYPNIKAVAKWLLNRIFDGDTVYEKGNEPFLNQCHIRECLQKLLQ